MFGKKIRLPELKPESESDIERILSSDSDMESITPSSIPVNCEPELLKSSTGRTASLIQEILKLDNITINPLFDYSEDQVIYPILSTIGESPENTMFLDDLVSDGVLEKKIYERLIACPVHPNSISVSVRVYCPKCNSMNIEKLNLFEHKKCGHIMESKNFPFSDGSICSSCKKEIKTVQQEIKVLAMWYQCESCLEKCDDVTIKIHCRKHNHDFDAGTGKLYDLFCYKLKTLHIAKNSDSTQIKNEMVKLLNGFNFTTKQNEMVKGHSGNVHEIPIYSESNTSKESLLIFIKNQFEPIQESDMNSVLISKLDIDPDHVLFVTPTTLEDSVEKLCTHYSIKVISEPDFSKIISRAEEFVSSLHKNNGAKK